LNLSKLIAPNHEVYSIVRTPDHDADVEATGAMPVHLSLEDSSELEFTDVFTAADVVYFIAGAGGKGGEERTKAVDYEGALKVFNAIEKVVHSKPRLILVSAIDIRIDEENFPAHYVRCGSVFFGLHN
jgi:nucleoside-diphosphate-sugar epimerase